jgi:hypothetical protein
MYMSSGLEILVLACNVDKPSSGGEIADSIVMCATDPIPKSAYQLAGIFHREAARIYGAMDGDTVGVHMETKDAVPSYAYKLTVTQEGQKHLELGLTLNPTPGVTVRKTMTMRFEAVVGTTPLREASIQFLNAIGQYIDSIGWESKLVGYPESGVRWGSRPMSEAADIFLLSGKGGNLRAKGYAVLDVIGPGLAFLKDKPVCCLGYFL